jgi:hypothetical protein
MVDITPTMAEKHRKGVDKDKERKRRPGEYDKRCDGLTISHPVAYSGRNVNSG